MSEHDPKDAKDGEGEPSRRGFVALAAIGSCALAAGVGIPAAAFIAAPLRISSGKGARFVVAKLDELELNVPKRVSVIGDEVDAFTRAAHRRLGSVWLLRTGPTEVRALSVICPHLGCGIELSADAKQFACPCHDSSFNLQGDRAAGPSPRGMDPLPVEVSKEGEVAVVFKRYRIGIEAREELG